MSNTAAQVNVLSILTNVDVTTGIFEETMIDVKRGMQTDLITESATVQEKSVEMPIASEVTLIQVAALILVVIAVRPSVKDGARKGHMAEIRLSLVVIWRCCIQRGEMW